MIQQQQQRWVADTIITIMSMAAVMASRLPLLVVMGMAVTACTRHPTATATTSIRHTATVAMAIDCGCACSRV